MIFSRVVQCFAQTVEGGHYFGEYGHVIFEQKPDEQMISEKMDEHLEQAVVQKVFAEP